MKRSLVAACVAMLATPMIAGAGAGDARLVNGVLEWPAVVTNEPFVIVRGDDGGAYYVAVGATRREASVKAGTRVVVIGLEGRTPHEISAVGFGSGPNPEAAMAELLAGRPPVAGAAAAPATSSAPANGAASATAAPALIAPTVITPAPAGVTATAPPPAAAAPAGPAPVASAPAIAAPAAPAPAVAAPAAPAIAAPAVSAPAAVAPAAPTPAAKAPTNGTSVPAATQPVPTPTPAAPRGPAGDLVQTSTPPAAKSAPQPTVVTTAPMLAPRDDQRWVELIGEVESVSGRTLVLRTESGRVNVDATSLRSNLERTIVPGSTIKVYGLPVELRFKAMGFIDPGTQTHGSNSR